MPGRSNRLAEINVPLAIAWLAVAVLGVQAVFPPLRALINSYVLTLGLYAVVILATLSLYKFNQIKVDLVLLFSTFALLFVACSTALAGNAILFNRYFNLICLTAGYPLFRLVVDRMGKKKGRHFSISSLVLQRSLASVPVPCLLIIPILHGQSKVRASTPPDCSPWALADMKLSTLPLSVR